MNFQDSRQIDLEKAIGRTIVFFDLFAYPLTATEIWQFLPIKSELTAVISCLERMADKFPEQAGFYHVSGRAEIIQTRLERYNYTAQKFKIALRVSRIFKLVPFIKMIAVSNIIGAHNLRDQSDIDLFIITSPRRLWLTRFICAGLMKIANLRPRPGNKRNKICLSFYITTASLNLESLKLGVDDWYFNYWLINLIPIVNRAQTYEQLLIANDWLNNLFPNWQPLLMANQRYLAVGNKNFSEWSLLTPILNFLEDRTKSWQLKIMPAALKSLMNQDTRVIINDEMLKLYLVDRRAEFVMNYQNNIDKYLI